MDALSCLMRVCVVLSVMFLAFSSFCSLFDETMREGEKISLREGDVAQKRNKGGNILCFSHQ